MNAQRPQPQARVISSAGLPFGLGQDPRELIEIAGADQPAPAGVAAGRHGPVLAGDAATPDQPPRVLAPQLPEPGVLGGSTPRSAHGTSWAAVGMMPSPGIGRTN